jgi:hypothetical protein
MDGTDVVQWLTDRSIDIVFVVDDDGDDDATTATSAAAADVCAWLLLLRIPQKILVNTPSDDSRRSCVEKDAVVLVSLPTSQRITSRPADADLLQRANDDRNGLIRNGRRRCDRWGARFQRPRRRSVTTRRRWPFSRACRRISGLIDSRKAANRVAVDTS